VPLNQLTVFCGTQGTGKSTVAKLFSTFLWLEKALVRGDFSEEYMQLYNRFVRQLLAYHGIDGYVQPDTLLHFLGQEYEFLFHEGRFEVIPTIDDVNYQRPQIMYYPAERNLLGVIERSSSIKGMPESLSTLLQDYRTACQSLDGEVELPVCNVRFRYDILNQIGSIVSDGYRVRLSRAASGLQSVAPLYVTLRHLYEVTSQGKDLEYSRSSAEEKAVIDERINRLLEDDTLDDETRARLVKKLSGNVSRRMVSIVEEPEQNLFPDSQQMLLDKLIEYSAQGENQLIVTTHSPYLLNRLMMCIKARMVSSAVTDDLEREEVDALVPREAQIDGRSVSVFQLTPEGSIVSLPTLHGLPSDENYLNEALMKSNIVYAQLVEIESRNE